MQSLRINVSELFQKPGEKINWHYNDWFCVDEIGFKDKAKVNAIITNVGKRILFHGRLTAGIVFQCSRCLESYVHQISEEIDEEFVPDELAPKEGKELSLEELSIFPYKEETIDIGEMMRQYIVLACPVQPLCNENCGGLCVQCGQNLNKEKCNCKLELIDPRWTALKDMNLSG